MAISLLGEANSGLGSSPTTYTPSVGSYLAVFASAQADVTAVSDGTNTYTKQGVSYSGTTGFFMALFVSSKILVSAAYTINITTAGATPSVWVGEIGGSSGYQTSIGNVQAPGVNSTDGITSGLLGTLSAQPALIYSVSFTIGGAVPCSAGTGFTIATASGWTGFAASESKRVTATTSVAATWTNTGGTSKNFITIAAVFTETAAGAPQPPLYNRRNTLYFI